VMAWWCKQTPPAMASPHIFFRCAALLPINLKLILQVLWSSEIVLDCPTRPFWQWKGQLWERLTS
jgi:hypothetical protein